MSEESRWQERYQNGETPWDTGRADSQLTRMLLEFPIPPCNLLEIGCGTGTNAIWLARHKFRVTGVDISETAIQKAKEKALEAKVRCEFISADFLNEKITGAPFDFLFDRGCFHSFYENHEEQKRFAENAARHLNPSGLWLNFSGSADDPPRDTGPPRISAADIVLAVEPYFEILLLKASYFDSNRPNPPRSWICLMRKRVNS